MHCHSLGECGALNSNVLFAIFGLCAENDFCRTFLKELEKYEFVPEDVAHCFMAWAANFDLYVTYCMHNQMAQTVIAEPATRDYFAVR